MKTKGMNAHDAQSKALRPCLCVCAQRRLPAQYKTTYKAISRASSIPSRVVSEVRSSVSSLVTTAARTLATMEKRTSFAFDIP